MWQLEKSISLLEEECVESSNFILLFDQDLKVLVDNGDGQKDTSTTSDGAKEVSEDWEGTNAQTTKGSGRWDVAVELVDHWLISVAAHDHLLLFELLGNILGRWAGHIDPGLREEGAWAEHEDDVDDGMEWIIKHCGEALRWG